MTEFQDLCCLFADSHLWSQTRLFLTKDILVFSDFCALRKFPSVSFHSSKYTGLPGFFLKNPPPLEIPLIPDFIINQPRQSPSDLQWDLIATILPRWISFVVLGYFPKFGNGITGSQDCKVIDSKFDFTYHNIDLLE